MCIPEDHQQRETLSYSLLSLMILLRNSSQLK
uniref:Uncharacterized protein n=1 Tax=Anguilla anguilla TaxID=7936 RepID=A0A0E9V696_ANGAN